MENFKVRGHFAGIVQKVQTIKSGEGAYRITIDVPENCREAIKELMDLQNKVCGFAFSEPVVVKEEEDGTQGS